MSRILITGSDGYIGLGVAKNLLQSTDHDLFLWVRSKNQDELQQKKNKLTRFLGQESEGRYRVFTGDLLDEEPFASVPSEEVDVLIHSAAVIRFNVESEMADDVNIEGARKIFDFAQKAKNIKQVNYLSTVYASGQVEGAIEERLYPVDIPFTNHYERSKNAAESILVNKFPNLPWNIVRVATIIADDESGHVTQFNAIHNTLRLLYNGLISLVPGKEETPLYFVTKEFVCQAITSVVESGMQHKIFNVCHTEEESANLGELLNIVFEVFEADDSFQQRRILRPIMVSENDFQTIASDLQSVSTGIVGDAMASVSPFAGQLFRHKTFLNQQLRETMPNYRAPEIKNLIKNTTRYLVSSKWGRT